MDFVDFAQVMMLMNACQVWSCVRPENIGGGMVRRTIIDLTMLRLRAISFERFVSAMPGWLFMLAAMAIIGAVLIVPQWLSCRELAWRAEVMKAQTQRLEDLHGRYIAFLDALNNEDLDLYEQLAFSELRLKPEGTNFVMVRNGLSYVPISSGHREGNSIERQLTVSMDVVGEEVEPLEPINTRLVRMTTKKKSRIVLLVMGLGCLVLGLWPSEHIYDNGDEA
ncbi:hypothetical protein JD969_02360 [Planctomycetota bacterium]|nr:hypothetical protein JD969_02360 [Planctomycetota bacterium]